VWVSVWVGGCWFEGVGYIFPRMWGVTESQQRLQQGEQQYVSAG